MDKKSNQDSDKRELTSVIKIDGSNGKISHYKSPYKINDNGNNPTTLNTFIFRGVFENKVMVCVRRFENLKKSETKEISQEKAKNQITRDIDALQEPQHLHENFIRYFCNEENADFVYVATEWCICSVEDLYDRNKNGKNWTGETIDVDIIKKSLGEKELLRQATEGLSFLHSLGFVHRNLKPSNFLIAQLQQYRGFRYLVKLSDFRMSKNPVECPTVSGTTGSKGWTYPKPTAGTKADASLYKSGDVFILGCFFYYVLTNGQHPFGHNKLEREKNMTNGNYFVYGNEWEPTNITDKRAIVLLKEMIKFNLNEICELEKIFESRYFVPQNYYKLYDLPDVKPGLCVIINQERFHNEKSNRRGSSHDKKSLKIVFCEFGFDVTIYNDLKAKDLLYCIDELTKQDFSSYASLVVCILSHGEEEVVYGVDGTSLNINKLKYKFNSNDCPTLNGKPKIWIIQACQGRKDQNSIQPNPSKVSDASSKSDSSGENVTQQNPQGFNEYPVPIKRQKENPAPSLIKESTSPDDLSKRPPLMDFLDVRASISEYAAFRGEDFGTFLIQYLCGELANEYLRNNTSNQEEKSLEDILKNVQNHINSSKILIENDKKVPIEVKQTIEWRASLSDRIAFKKAKTPGRVTHVSISEHRSEDGYFADWLPSWLKEWFFVQ